MGAAHHKVPSETPTRGVHHIFLSEVHHLCHPPLQSKISPSPTLIPASTTSSSPTMARLEARKGARLPIEICERIINFVAGFEDHKYRDPAGETNQALLACCLTCRAWSHRSRFHLFSAITLQSAEQLTAVASTLLASPLLYGQVEELHIDGSLSGDQGWITTVPLQLASKLHLDRLIVEGVDFSKMHPVMYQSFSLFRTCRVEFRWLGHIEWAKLRQLSRIISAIQPHAVFLNNSFNSPKDVGPVTPNAPISHIGQFDLRQTCIEMLRIDVTTLKEGLSFLRSWTSIPASLREVYIHVTDACDGLQIRAAVAVADRFMQLLQSHSHQLMVVYSLNIPEYSLKIGLIGALRSDMH